MGIDRITAYTIATRDDIVISHGGPGKGEYEGKYVGWITLGEPDRFRPLLSTQPVFDSAEEADEAMNKVVEDIRAYVHEETGGIRDG